jgi:hypothetical protein
MERHLGIELDLDDLELVLPIGLVHKHIGDKFLCLLPRRKERRSLLRAYGPATP